MPAPASPLLDALQSVWPVDRWAAQPVLIAVSGGPDSVALLHAMHSLALDRPCQLIVGHVHHGLRDSADRDAQIVESMAAQFGLPFRLRQLQLNTHPTWQGEGLEGQARQSRYAALHSIAREVGARTIATGHTQDDQVETILFRLLRGTGIAGLRGIPVFREFVPGLTLARPLLQVRRVEILDYLQQHGLTWTHDESNDDVNIARNQIRQIVLPALRDAFPWPIDKSLLKLSESASEYDRFVEETAAAAVDTVIETQEPSSVRMSRPAFLRLPHVVRRALLRQIWRQQAWPEQQMNRAAWHELELSLESLADSTHVGLKRGEAASDPEGPPLRRQFPGGIHVRRSGDTLELTDDVSRPR